MGQRQNLSDILPGSQKDSIAATWESTTAADDFVTLPKGTYVAHIIGGELFTSKSNSTPGFKLRFKVLEGEHEGRHFWHDVWLTAAAMPMAKRDLGKLGITNIEQLEQPLKGLIRVEAKVALRRDDDGNEFNRLQNFKVLGIDEPQRDAFAPTDDTPAEAADTVAFEFGENQQNGESAEDIETPSAAVAPTMCEGAEI